MESATETVVNEGVVNEDRRNEGVGTENGEQVGAQKNESAANNDGTDNNEVAANNESDVTPEPWLSSPLVLNVSPVFAGNARETIPKSLVPEPTLVNICDYLGHDKKKNYNRLYFCTKTYPPPHSMSFDGVPSSLDKVKLDFTLHNLKNYIYREANKSGIRLYSDGGIKKHACKIRCSDAIGRANDTRVLARARKEDSVDGRKRRRTSTSARHCPFGFSLKWDTMGFFVSLHQNAGCNLHKYHPKMDAGTRPKRLLEDKAKEMDYQERLDPYLEDFFEVIEESKIEAAFEDICYSFVNNIAKQREMLEEKNGTGDNEQKAGFKSLKKDESKE